MIIDNQVKRSFAADVNTIIALFSAPDDKKDIGLNNTARFVAFKVPFEHIISPVIFEEIEEASERKSMEEYRIHPINQGVLLNDGIETSVKDKKPSKASGPLIKVTRYIGNKWGGKYLRAPDIYWTILKKGKGKLVRLGDIADVRFGIKTGANEFFYFNDARIRELGIEDEFLKKVIKSPRECKRILIDPNDLKHKIFMCHKDISELKGTAALEYIKWGETSRKDGQGNEIGKFHERPSCRGRGKWWDLGKRSLPLLNFNYLINTTAKTLYDPNGCYASDNFQEIHIEEDLAYSMCLSLNSTIFQIMVNIEGRSNFGGGLLKIQTYEVSELLCLNPVFIDYYNKKILNSESWDVLYPSSERRNMDEFIFKILNLTKSESEAIYESVIKLVENRLSKAESV